MAKFIKVTPIPGSIEFTYVNMDMVRTITPRKDRVVLAFTTHDVLEITETVEQISKKMVAASKEIYYEVKL